MKKPKLQLVERTDQPVPEGLSPEAEVWFIQIAEEYGIRDRGGIAVLTAGAQAYNRMLQAQALLDRDGLVTHDRWGQAKPHPAAVIERDARGQMLSALRQLHLDLEPLHSRPGRPGGSRSY